MSEMFNPSEITKALRLFFQPGDVFEVRVLDAGINAVELSEAIDLILGFMDYPEPLTDCKNCKSNDVVFCQEGKECKFERAEEETVFLIMLLSEC